VIKFVRGELFKQPVSVQTRLPQGLPLASRRVGLGVAAENRDRILEYFVTKPPGVGIAISMCRSIIEAHGGPLWGTTSMCRLAPSSGSRCRCGSKRTFSDPNHGLANTSDRPIETNHASCCDASQDVSLRAPHVNPATPVTEKAACRKRRPV
jgi:hypothetical protein